MKLRFLFLFLFISFPLFAADDKVVILENTHNDVIKEASLINQLCGKYFSGSSFRFSSQRLSGFDVNALFLKSNILARKVCNDANSSYILIPASLPMGNNLIRARLIIYQKDKDEFTTIYDKVVSTLDVDEYIENNIVKIFSHFGFEDMGIVIFPEKEHGFSLYIDGLLFEDRGMLSKGEHTISVTAEGYKEYKDKISIKPLELNAIDFELEREGYKNLLISTDGLMYNATSSDIGTFTLPFFMESYSTPSSLSFSYPGFETKYMSLTTDINNINISLKPTFLSDENWMNLAVNDFYKSVLFTLSAFALDLTSRSLLNKTPNSEFLKNSRDTFSNVAYFSLGIFFAKIVDYYFSSVYAFK